MTSRCLFLFALAMMCLNVDRKAVFAAEVEQWYVQSFRTITIKGIPRGHVASYGGVYPAEIHGSYDGRVLDGYWVKEKSSRKCPSAKYWKDGKSSAHWGMVRLEVKADNKVKDAKVEGFWNYCGKKGKNFEWNVAGTVKKLGDDAVASNEAQPKKSFDPQFACFVKHRELIKAAQETIRKYRPGYKQQVKEANAFEANTRITLNTRYVSKKRRVGVIRLEDDWTSTLQNVKGAVSWGVWAIEGGGGPIRWALGDPTFIDPTPIGRAAWGVDKALDIFIAVATKVEGHEMEYNKAVAKSDILHKHRVEVIDQLYAARKLYYCKFLWKANKKLHELATLNGIEKAPGCSDKHKATLKRHLKRQPLFLGHIYYKWRGPELYRC